MQALQQFVNQSPWDPLPVRRRIAQRLSEVIRPQVWVIDDVSFPKCGRASAGVARQYCGALGKRANCQVAVSVHAATDTASCPLDRQLYLPREWTDEPGRCRRAGVPDDVVHQEKWRLALGLLDNVGEWGLKAPVVVADAGYGVSTPFRPGLEERGLSYVLALTGKEVARELDIEPHQPDYGGLGPPTLARYRTTPRALTVHAAEAAAVDHFAEVAWRQGSKGTMTSRFAVLALRAAGKQSLAAAQAAGGGRNQWNGVLPRPPSWSNGLRTRTGPRVTGYRTCRPRLPSRSWCGGRRCAGASNTTTANSSTAWAWTTSRDAPGAGRTSSVCAEGASACLMVHQACQRSVSMSRRAFPEDCLNRRR